MTPLEFYLSSFLSHKEAGLSHRYITLNHIEPLLKNLPKSVAISSVGTSVEDRHIYALTLGHGSKRILMWSQMHGNESTTTKAVFDVVNSLTAQNSNILEACTLCIVPILNPDGAQRYTRENANGVDLNRDAQDHSQPESKALRQLFDDFKPHFCFNLHGQRTIFSAGSAANPATVSFLSPAQDEACTVTKTRQVAMSLIVEMAKMLQALIPDQVGIYDDTFNINCVGDTFQSLNVPTILFEAGHFKDDYDREEVRKFIYFALHHVLSYISENETTTSNYADYFDIPENKKLFFDLIIRNAKTAQGMHDIAIQYKEQLVDHKIHFIPEIKKITELGSFYGHNELDAEGQEVTLLDGSQIIEGIEIDFVLITNEKYSLKLA